MNIYETEGNMSMTVTNISDEVTSPGHPVPLPLPPAHLGALVVLAVGGALSNGLLLGVIGCSRSLRTLSAIFLVLLNLADLIVCLSVLPLSSAALPGAPTPPWVTAPWACDVAGVVYVLFRWTSLLTVALISIDRCVAIRAPLRYPKLLTKGRATGAAVVTVGTAGVLSILPAAGFGRYAYSPGGGMCTPDYPDSPAYGLLLLLGAACLPLAVTLAAYGAVAEVALRTAKRGKVVCDEVNCSYVASRRDEVKPVQTLATITGVYAICWVPYIGVHLWSLAWNRRPARHLEATTECLVLLSSALNPWMYSMMDRSIRTAIKTVCTTVKARAETHCRGTTQGVDTERTHHGGEDPGGERPKQVQETVVLNDSENRTLTECQGSVTDRATADVVVTLNVKESPVSQTC